jgi:hypothetical protein
VSNAAYMDFDEPPTPRGASSSGGKKRESKSKGSDGDAEKPKAVIARLPDNRPALTGDEIKRGVSERSRAAANLKVEGMSYDEIADVLDFPDARAAKRAVESTLAAIHGPGDYETLRVIASTRAERQFSRSAAMAGAAFLVDSETGEKLPNIEQLRWHQQASADLMNWAVITGAKAPSKVEITPGDEAMDKLLQQIARRAGHEDIVDAEVLDFDDIPPEVEDFDG